MANCLLSWVNWLDMDGVTITPSSEAATLPATNLINPIRARIWSASAETAPTLAIDLGTVRPVRGAVLNGLNLAPTDTVRLQLSIATPGGADVLDTGPVAGVVPGYGYWPWFGGAALMARYVTVAIASATVTPQAGRLWISDAWQPTRNYSYDEGDKWNDGAVIQTAPRSGAQYPQPGPKWRTETFALGALTEVERRTTAKEFMRVAGTSGQVCFVKDPDSPYRFTETIIGRLRQTQPILHRAFPIGSTAFEIDESL